MSIPATLRANAIKKFRLGQYLKEFHHMKVNYVCDQLIIGGDFNFNMDTLLDTVISYENPLKNIQEELICIFKAFELKIVPYQHQREKGKTKFDALICNEDLSKQFTVSGYCNKFNGRDGNTLLKNTFFSHNSLDHDPLLFTTEENREVMNLTARFSQASLSTGLTSRFPNFY